MQSNWDSEIASNFFPYFKIKKNLLFTDTRYGNEYIISKIRIFKTREILEVEIKIEFQAKQFEFITLKYDDDKHTRTDTDRQFCHLHNNQRVFEMKKKK